MDVLRTRKGFFTFYDFSRGSKTKTQEVQKQDRVEWWRETVTLNLKDEMKHLHASSQGQTCKSIVKDERNAAGKDVVCLKRPLCFGCGAAYNALPLPCSQLLLCVSWLSMQLFCKSRVDVLTDGLSVYHVGAWLDGFVSLVKSSGEKCIVDSSAVPRERTGISIDKRFEKVESCLLRF